MNIKNNKHSIRTSFLILALITPLFMITSCATIDALSGFFDEVPVAPESSDDTIDYA
jgi:hypothetical protein